MELYVKKLRYMLINIGSTHDARIWRSSRVKAVIEGQSEFTVAGDSAYPITKTLVKSFLKPLTPRHESFNTAQQGLRTQCTECTFGIMKNRDDMQSFPQYI